MGGARAQNLAQNWGPKQTGRPRALTTFGRRRRRLAQLKLFFYFQPGWVCFYTEDMEGKAGWF